MKTIISLLFATTLMMNAGAQSSKDEPISLEPFSSSAHHWYDIYDKSNIIFPQKDQPRYKPSEITAIADNILLYQRNNGGWPKNYDMQAVLTENQKDSIIQTKDILNTTFDNSTTYSHIQYLAKVYAVVKDEKYKSAGLKGIDFILAAQYPNGGWPQYFPLEEDDYSRHITFNDGAYVGILKLLKEILDQKPEYQCVTEQTRQRIRIAYDKGLDCLLQCQIRDHGILTAWCQQHDEVTLKPTWARAFEPPSITNGESAGIVLFLMSVDNPDERIIKSIQSAVKWFDDSKIPDTRVKIIDAPAEKSKYKEITSDRVVVEDTTARPIWTRYYELRTHRPLFCDRNSHFLYSLAEVSRERRAGYAWYIYDPQEVLDKYPKWQEKWAPQENILKN